MEYGTSLAVEHCDPQCIDNARSGFDVEVDVGADQGASTSLHDLCIAIKTRLDGAREQKDRLLYVALYSDCLSEILRRTRRATAAINTRQ